MRRYTARFAGGGEPQSLRLALDRYLYGTLSVYNLRADATLTDDCWEVEVGSDSDREGMRQALLGFAARHGLRLVNLRWGWLLSRTPGEVANVVAPPAPRLYLVRWPPLALVLLLRVAAFLSLAAWFLLARPTLAENLWTVLLLALFWGVAFSRADYPFTRVSAVRLDADELEVAYWLLPGRQFFTWSALDYLKLHPTGLDCELRAGHARAVLPLSLLSGQPGRDLVGNIVAASGLALADDLPRGGAVYRRPAPNPT